MAETRCVNDTNGDGDCAACAHNSQAWCRVPVDACDGCRLTGRCAEHPANGRLSLVDCVTELRDVVLVEAGGRPQSRKSRPAPKLDRFEAMIERAIECADWEPGDAQRALRELRDTYREIEQ